MRIGPTDPTLTGAAGLAAVTELVDRLELVDELDDGIGPIKQRNRGLGAALRHLPEADPEINRVWRWAAILAGWISAPLQAVTG